MASVHDTDTVALFAIHTQPRQRSGDGRVLALSNLCFVSLAACVYRASYAS